MNVLSRKMFNRGARKELRKKGGIEDVQYFQTAGPVNVPGTPAPYTNPAGMNIPGLQGPGVNPYFNYRQALAKISPKQFGYPAPVQSTRGFGKLPGTGSFTYPTDRISSIGSGYFSADTKGRPLSDIAKQALEEGVGSLGVLEQGRLGAAFRRFQGKQGLSTLLDEAVKKTDFPVVRRIDQAAPIVGDVLGTIGGFTEGVLGSAFAGTEPGTPGGDIGGAKPGTPQGDLKKFYESLGISFLTDSPTQQGRPFQDLTDDADTMFPDIPAFASLTDQDKKINEDIKDLLYPTEQKNLENRYDADNVPEIDAAINEDIRKLLYPKEPDPELNLENLITKETEGKKRIKTEIKAEDKAEEPELNESNSVEITNDDTNETVKIPDLKNANVQNPINRPDNWSNIVAKAKNNTGVVNKSTDADTLVDMEREKGLGTAKDFAAELLSMLPKYGEDDARDKGLNLAMIGFSIMAGDSPNPLVNIGKGVMKVLPSIMKDVKDKKKYDRDIQTITAQYGIKKADAIEQEKRKKSEYIVSQDFTDSITGRKYFANQKINLNDEGYNDFVKSGGAAYLTTAEIQKQNIVSAAAVRKAEIENKGKLTGIKNVNDMYEKTTQFKPFPGDDFSIPVQYAKAGAQGLGLPDIRIVNEKGTIDALYSHYEGKVGDFQRILETTESLRKITFTEKVTGGAAIFAEIDKGIKSGLNFSPRLLNAYNRLTGTDLTDKNLTYKNQFEIKHRMLTLEVTPLLLGESAKTISDADRVLIAQALGFENAKMRGKEGEGVDFGKQKVFTSSDEIREALVEVDKYMLKEVKKVNRTFTGSLRGLGIEMPETEVQPSEVAQVFDRYAIVDGKLQLKDTA